MALRTLTGQAKASALFVMLLSLMKNEASRPLEIVSLELLRLRETIMLHWKGEALTTTNMLHIICMNLLMLIYI